jgi:hypothetical protein
MRFLSIFFVVAGCGEMAGGNTAGGKRVFISSGSFGALALTGVCGRAATAVQLGGAWTEWLSGAGHDAIDVVTGDGPWRRLDGQVVFNDHAGLAALPLVNIDIDEYGSKLPSAVDVWTGTHTGGRVSSDDCNDWSDTSLGTWGTIGNTYNPPQWTASNIDHCDVDARVYCFEL